MAQCEALKLGGRTPADPCPSWLGDNCTVDDWGVVRGLLLLEHNALVRSLNQWNVLVGEGKAKWSPIPTAAWAVYEESSKTLEDYSTWLTNIFAMTAGVSNMMTMAMSVHAATCDLDGDLLALGEPVPQKPIPPAEPLSIAQEFTNFAKEATKGLGLLIVLGLATWAGVNYMRSSR